MDGGILGNRLEDSGLAGSILIVVLAVRPSSDFTGSCLRVLLVGNVSD